MCLSFFSKCFFRNIGSFKNITDWYIKMFCEIIVSLVSTWDCHYSTCTISSKHIIPNPNWDRFLSKWMKCKSSCKHPTDGFHIRHTIAFRSLSTCFNIGGNCFFLLCCSNHFHQIVFWSQGHKGHSK